MTRDPFTAIADPTRREIIGLLAEAPMTINEVADQFSDVSRQAISKQIRYLEESGLLQVKQNGRERYCYVKLDNLKEVEKWVSQYERFWNYRLDRLGSYLSKKK